MGSFDPRSREEQAHLLYRENVRSHEVLQGNKRKSEVRLNLRFWSNVPYFSEADMFELAASTTPSEGV